MQGCTYPSDLTDEQWILLSPLLPAPKSGTAKGGRPREVDLRQIVNGIRYQNRSGCQWRMLPTDFGPWPTVHGYYRAWRRDGVVQRLHDTLREQVRVAVGKEATPSAGILDSQSVKTTEKKGFAAGTTRARRSMAASATS
jgi:transposase